MLQWGIHRNYVDTIQYIGFPIAFSIRVLCANFQLGQDYVPPSTYPDIWNVITICDYMTIYGMDIFTKDDQDRYACWPGFWWVLGI